MGGGDKKINKKLGATWLFISAASITRESGSRVPLSARQGRAGRVRNTLQYTTTPVHDMSIWCSLLNAQPGPLWADGAHRQDPREPKGGLNVVEFQRLSSREANFASRCSLPDWATSMAFGPRIRFTVSHCRGHQRRPIGQPGFCRRCRQFV